MADSAPTRNTFISQAVFFPYLLNAGGGFLQIFHPCLQSRFERKARIISAGPPAQKWETAIM